VYIHDTLIIKVRRGRGVNYSAGDAGGAQRTAADIFAVTAAPDAASAVAVARVLLRRFGQGQAQEWQNGRQSRREEKRLACPT
jgi:hypothetical protein